MALEIELGKEQEIVIYRERRPTLKEKKRDPEANVMAESVTITFGTGEPKIVVNRTLCHY